MTVPPLTDTETLKDITKDIIKTRPKQEDICSQERPGRFWNIRTKEQHYFHTRAQQLKKKKAKEGFKMGFEEHRSPRREHTERFTWLLWRYPLNLSLNSCHFMCIVAHTIIFLGDRRVCLSVWTNENFTIGGYTSGVFPCLLHDIYSLDNDLFSAYHVTSGC